MSGLDRMKQRMEYDGGDVDGRLVKAKFKSFHAALKSYQGEWITFNDKIHRCLINADKLKEDYDIKMISVGFDANIKEGDVFLWNRTNTHWLVYLQQHSEEAYFRAQIRKCSYQIDIDGTLYWMSVTGPAEKSIEWATQHNIAYNKLNYTAILYITKNEVTNEYFNRHKKIKFDGHNWTVAVVDRYSQDAVLEVVLEEDFNNSFAEEESTPEIIIPDETLPYIDGPREIRVYDTSVVYSIKNMSNGSWLVNSSKVKIVNSDSSMCEIDVLTGKSNSFKLSYVQDDGAKIDLDVTIKSL